MATKVKLKPRSTRKHKRGKLTLRGAYITGKRSGRSDAQRLDRIAEIIEAVDQRCLEADGPVTPTLQEMEQAEISEIYALAKRRE